MSSDRFDFVAARAVAFAKFCDMHRDKKLQDWVSRNSTAVGNQLNDGRWAVDFLVFQSLPSEADDDCGEADFANSIDRHMSSPIPGYVKLLGGSGDYCSVEIFKVVLDEKKGDIEVVYSMDFAGFDFKSHEGHMEGSPPPLPSSR
jgi:hypothetical protein